MLMQYLPILSSCYDKLTGLGYMMLKLCNKQKNKIYEPIIISPVLLEALVSPLHICAYMRKHNILCKPSYIYITLFSKTSL